METFLMVNAGIAILAIVAMSVVTDRRNKSVAMSAAPEGQKLTPIVEEADLVFTGLEALPRFPLGVCEEWFFSAKYLVKTKKGESFTGSVTELLPSDYPRDKFVEKAHEAVRRDLRKLGVAVLSFDVDARGRKA